MKNILLKCMVISIFLCGTALQAWQFKLTNKTDSTVKVKINRGELFCAPMETSLNPDEDTGVLQSGACCITYIEVEGQRGSLAGYRSMHHPLGISISCGNFDFDIHPGDHTLKTFSLQRN